MDDSDCIYSRNEVWILQKLLVYMYLAVGKSCIFYERTTIVQINQSIFNLINEFSKACEACMTFALKEGYYSF